MYMCLHFGLVYSYQYQQLQNYLYKLQFFLKEVRQLQ